VESRSPGQKTISSYLAKYLSKSFHLRSLYQQHGLKDNHKTYRFFKNLYQYETRLVLIIAKHKLDAETGQHLPKNQKIFRHYDYETTETTYFYRTNEQLSGHVVNPILLKKNYRLGIRTLNPLALLKLATKHPRKELYQFQKPKKTYQLDFQEFLITHLLFWCQQAEFFHTPLEQEQVPKEADRCSNSIYHHFQVKPVLRFSFAPAQASIVRSFLNQLDTYAMEFDMEEAQEFYFYPISHDHQHEVRKQCTGLCGCEVRARNQYLDN